MPQSGRDRGVPQPPGYHAPFVEPLPPTTGQGGGHPFPDGIGDNQNHYNEWLNRAVFAGLATSWHVYADGDGALHPGMPPIWRGDAPFLNPLYYPRSPAQDATPIQGSILDTGALGG